MGSRHAQKRNFFRFANTETSTNGTESDLFGNKPKPRKKGRGGRRKPKLPPVDQSTKRPRFSSMNNEAQKNSILSLFNVKTTKKSIAAQGNVNRPSLFHIGGRGARKSKQVKGGVRRSTLNLFNLFNNQDKKLIKEVQKVALPLGNDDWEIRQTISGRIYYWNNTTGSHSFEKPEELMTSFEKEENSKEWVWIPHARNYWQPAVIVSNKPNGGTQVRTMEQRLVNISAIKIMKNDLTAGETQRVPLIPLNRGELDIIVEDLVELGKVNEGTVLHNSRMRYERQQIYSWIGPSRNVLLAVNPYEDLGLYTEEYKKKYEFSAVSLDVPKPHVFSIAAECVYKLSTQGRSQSILVSGESGSGKTQATKQCLDFITYIAGSTKIMPVKKKAKAKSARVQKAPGRNGRRRRNRKRNKREMPGEKAVVMATAGPNNALEDKILNCNPIMETFGNSKTVRNNNSSRFGKWIVMYMNMKRKQVVGARIEQFLLETTRVISQAENERNYHAFYQIFTDEELCKAYDLTSPEDFFYTNQGNCFVVDGQQPIDDAQEMKNVKTGMEKLGFEEIEIKWFYKIVCAVLHLGNVNFTPLIDGCQVSEEDNSLFHFKKTAEILEIDGERLNAVLISRSIRTSKDVTIKKLSLDRAINARDSLAKAIYGKLFSYLIERINECFGSHDSGRFIGILDIFGFESFEYNSFEQLCINFTNERLQKLFNESTFLEEQELYKMEKVKYEVVDFVNNQLVLDIIDTRPYGIFNLLDDECKAAKSSTTTLLKRINGQHSQKFKLFKAFEDSGSFEIKHFAGAVRYSVDDFVSKNIDALNQDIYEVCSESTDVYTNVLFPPMKDYDKVKIKSTSARFREQLSQLIGVLEETHCHFIRCIKPNNEQVSRNFNGRKVKVQLDAGAVIDSIRVRQCGFSHKMFHEDFFKQYKCVNGFKFRYNLNKSSATLCRTLISTCFELSMSNLEDKIQVGDTRVLFNTEAYKFLELRKTFTILDAVVRIQAIHRGKQARRFIELYREIRKNFEAAIKNKDLEKIEEIEENMKNTMGKFGKRYRFAPRRLELAKRKIREERMWEPIKRKFVRYDVIDFGDIEMNDEVINNLNEEEIDQAISEVLEMEKKAENPMPVPVKHTLKNLRTLRQLLDSHKLNKKFMEDMEGDMGKGMDENNMDTLRRNEIKDIAIQMSSPEEFAKKEKAKAVKYIETEGASAIKNLDRAALKNMALRAQEFEYNSPIVTQIADILKIPEIEFLKKQIQMMNSKNKDYDRVEFLQKTVELKEAELIDNFDNFKHFHKLSTLRNPPEEITHYVFFCIPWRTGVQEQSFENAREIYGEAAKNRLLNKKRIHFVWQNDDFLYFSVLRLPDDLEDIAFGCFEQVFAYMEEFKSDEDGLNLIKTGVFQGGGNNPGLRNEIFAQIIKQLIRNPTAESRIRGIELLGLCLASFKPDDEEFENYLFIWMRLHLPYAIFKNYLSAVNQFQFFKTKNRRRATGANPRIKADTDLSEIRVFLDEARENTVGVDRESSDKWCLEEDMFRNILKDFDIDEDYNDDFNVESTESAFGYNSYKDGTKIIGSSFARKTRPKIQKKKSIKMSEKSNSAIDFGLDESLAEHEFEIDRRKGKSKKDESLNFSTVAGSSIHFGFEKKEPRKRRNRTARRNDIKKASSEDKEETSKVSKPLIKKTKSIHSSKGVRPSELELGFDQPLL